MVEYCYGKSNNITEGDFVMRYRIRRWHKGEGNHIPATELEDCERLEVVKQVINAIDYGQNFEAVVVGSPVEPPADPKEE